MTRRVVASLALLVFVLAACGSTEPPDVVGLSPRHAPAEAWVDDHFFVYGGSPQLRHPIDDDEDPFAGLPRSPEGAILSLTDGALFDPDSMAMDVLPEAPFDGPVQYPQAVAVGDEVVVLGIDCPHPNPDADSGSCQPGTYAAAVYSAIHDEWRKVALPSALDDVANGTAEAIGGTPDGHAVFLLGPREAGFDQLWSYEPSEDRWTRLPDSETWANARCLAGDTLAVMTGVNRRQPSLRLLTLSDDQLRWREAVAPSLGDPTEQVHQGPAFAQLDCTDDRVLFRVNTVEPQFHSVLPGDEQDAWTVPSPSPARGNFDRMLGIGDRMIFFNRNNVESAVYDPAADEWQLLEGDLDVLAPVWTGEALVDWPGDPGATQPRYLPFRPIP